MDRYTHVYRGDLATALNVLPDLATPALESAKRTGTDDVPAEVRRVSPHVSLNGGIRSTSVESEGINSEAADEGGNKQKALQINDLQGKSGERGIRTLDTGLTPYNGLANRRLQPLGHLSLCFAVSNSLPRRAGGLSLLPHCDWVVHTDGRRVRSPTPTASIYKPPCRRDRRPFADV
jgi:hypothetical protein